jgi:hypothetical protein
MLSLREAVFSIGTTNLNAVPKAIPSIKNEFGDDAVSDPSIGNQITPDSLSTALISELDIIPKEDTAFTNLQSALVRQCSILLVLILT